MQFEDTELADRAVVAIAGADAPAFLQGLVTADVLALRPGAAAYAALLTPQGKILFDFFVTFGSQSNREFSTSDPAPGRLAGHSRTSGSSSADENPHARKAFAWSRHSWIEARVHSTSSASRPG